MTILLVAIGIFVLATSSLQASNQSEAITTSLSVGSYVKCTMHNQEMTVMTNSNKDVLIMEDDEMLEERARFGKLAKIRVKDGSSYTILSDI